MGIFSRYLDDVKRVGAELGAELGCELTGPKEDRISWVLAGQRGGHSVEVTLNQMHGVYGVQCALRPLPLGSLRIMENDDFFAGANDPRLTGRLKASTIWDAAALWQLLPADTRGAIEELLSPKASSLSVQPGSVSALLGPSGQLRSGDAAAVILRSLDQLLAIAPVLERCWDVDPSGVGGGMGAGRPQVLVEPAAPPPPPVERREAAAIAARALPARAAMIARYEGKLLEPYPVIDVLGDRSGVIDRVVVVGPSLRTQWVSDLGYQIIPFGSPDRGWYFPRSNAEAFARVLRAIERFERSTGTKGVNYSVEVIGRITGDPTLAVVSGKAHFGLDLEILGAHLLGHAFIDATQILDGESPFEGEREGN